MVSSSTSRSRSARRSPSRRGEEAVSKTLVKEKPEASPAPPETPAAPEESASAVPSAPPDSEACEKPKPKTWKGWSNENDGGQARSTRLRSVGGGAVRNRRTAGTPGTFECPECYRVIQDNKVAREQHWDSRYCRARRLYNRGYGNKEECLQLADYEINKAWQKWNASQGVRLTDRPNEPKGPPPEGHSSGSKEQFAHQRQQPDAGYQRYRGRFPAGKHQKRERERTRERSRGRSRNDEGHEHSDRRRRERRHDGDAVDYVKVTVEREPHPAASDRRKQSRPETMRGSTRKDAKEKGIGRNVERREAGKETAESSEYTYTYDDSSASEEPEPGAQEQSALPAATKKSAEEQRAKKPAKPGAAQATAAKAKAGGPAAAQPPRGSGGGADQRRMAYFNALLRTAMETADSCGF